MVREPLPGERISDPMRHENFKRNLWKSFRDLQSEYAQAELRVSPDLDPSELADRVAARINRLSNVELIAALAS